MLIFYERDASLRGLVLTRECVGRMRESVTAPWIPLRSNICAREISILDARVDSLPVGKNADMDALIEQAKIQDCEEILASFRREYLEAAVTKEVGQAASENLTARECAAKTLGYLKGALRAVENSNKLHDNIDRKHFEELVRAGHHFITAGVDKKKGRKVLFFRSGRLYKGRYALIATECPLNERITSVAYKVTTS